MGGLHTGDHIKELIELYDENWKRFNNNFSIIYRGQLLPVQSL